MRCFKTTLQQMLTASWLINKPHKYPWIPKTGIAKNTLPMRMASPTVLIVKEVVVLPNPFRTLSREPFTYRKGQIHASVMIKLPARSLSEEQEKQTAEQSHEKTAAKYFLQQFSDAGCLVFDLKLGNCRHQHDRNRIGDGGRE